MYELTIQGGSGTSQLLVGERLANLTRYVPDGRPIIITDENIQHIYGSQFPDANIITIGCGEKNKTMETLAKIFEQLIALEADRSSYIVGIGGGIVGDITGFAASTYMRGVRFGFVATSLLAQVDATVGGKNGVNFKGYKNMVGVFNQPDFVIIDIGLLKTLPSKEIACGLAEIVKHACIADAGYFNYIENHIDEINTLDEPVMLHLVHQSVIIKTNVVNQDEREAGERRKLNFGHTLGHAFEKTLGISHGEAVSAGMILAAELSVRRGLLSETAFTRIKTLLGRLKLPKTIDFDRDAVFDALKKDKKRQRETIHFILLKKLGQAVIETVTIEEIGAWLKQQ